MSRRQPEPPRSSGSRRVSSFRRYRQLIIVSAVVTLILISGFSIAFSALRSIQSTEPHPLPTVAAIVTALAGATATAKINATATAEGSNATATSIPTTTILPTSIPTPSLVSSSKISDLVIRTTYPKVMELHHSYVVEMSLQSKSGVGSISALQSIYALIPASNPSTNVVTVTPVGTPNSQVKNAFGHGYKPFATATFFAGTFSVEPGMPQEQTLDQPEISWIWNITPQETGEQVMSGEIRIEWKSINQGNALTYSFIIGNPQIVVQVNGSFDWSSITTPVLITVLSACLIALLTWFGTQIWSQISKRRKDSKGNQATNTPNQSP